MPPLPRRTRALERRTFDLLVLGGGINGTGAARDAARRGLSVALVEKEDFGYGTTGRSTRLVHGGLRYLAMYDFALVRESLRERERLLHNAPHLVRPLAFVVPFYEGQRTPPWMVKLGLRLYDALAGASVIPPHRPLSRDEILALEPGLRQEGLRGGALYGDGQVDLAERLCVENALDAAQHGAVVLNHASVRTIESGANTRGFPLARATIRDELTGETVRVDARRILNTTGPWIDRTPGSLTVRSRTTKGAHVVTPPATTHAVLLFSPDDDRVFFSIPWLGHQLVGTTDTDHQGDPDDVHADADDVEYLRRGIRFVLPHADTETIHYAYAGIRNLVPETGRTESDVSRKHQIVRHDAIPEMVSLVGGKITPFRAVCEELVDLIAPPGAPASDTAHAPLPGAPTHLPTLRRALEDRCAELHIPPGVAHALATTYGTRAHHILDACTADPHAREIVCPHAPMLLAEARFAIEHEMARTAADILLRRTRTGWEPCEGRDALPRILDTLDTLLARTPAERAADDAKYREEIAKRHRFDAPRADAQMRARPADGARMHAEKR